MAAVELLPAALGKLSDAARALHDAIAEVASGDSTELTADAWLELRAQIGVLQAALATAGRRVDRALHLGGAQEKFLRYLRTHLGEIVSKERLSGVAGIYDFARRIRELRVEHGWRISSSMTRDDLTPGQYVLEADLPDEQLAADWRVAKRIRNLKTPTGRPASVKARLLEYLKAISPAAADKQQLKYVAHPSYEARRIRELAEEGWQIVSEVDDPDLPSGSYRMVALDQLPPRAREAIKLRHQIFDRDGYRCQDCGRVATVDHVQLQAHHLVLVSAGGSNEPDNLLTLCADCHAGRHALLGGAKTGDELLDPSSEPS